MNTRTTRLITPLLAAGLVVLLGACGSGDDDDAASDTPTTAADTPTTAAEDAAGATLSVTAQDIKFAATEPSTSAGSVTVELVNEGAAPHSFVIEGQDFRIEAPAGETVTGTVELAAGSYTFFCDIPGHRDAGMEGTLTVA